jgi:tRNA 2-thiouridine synthesizing protein D
VNDRIGVAGKELPATALTVISPIVVAFADSDHATQAIYSHARSVPATHAHIPTQRRRRDQRPAAAGVRPVSRVFFYYDGVHNANKLLEAPQDERQIGKLWADMARDHGVDLVVCVAAGLRRGLKDETLAEGFRISGLGQLIEVGIQADRVMTFGD